MPPRVRPLCGLSSRLLSLVLCKLQQAGRALLMALHEQHGCALCLLLGQHQDWWCADLVDNIRSGNFPEWDFMIQTMKPEEQEDFWFDPLDNTKVSSHCKAPCLAHWQLNTASAGCMLHALANVVPGTLH